MKSMKDHANLLEIGAEGGSIPLYKYFDDNNQGCYYYNNTQEIVFENLSIVGTDKNSSYSMSSAEAIIKVLTEFPNVLDLYPLYAHEDIQELVLVFIAVHVKEENHYFNFYNWVKVLELSEEELRKRIENQ